MGDDVGSTEVVAPSAAREPVPASAAPLDIAMAAVAEDRGLDSPARVLLGEQTRLVRVQTASERAGLTLKVLTALAGVAIAAALGWAVWSASKYQGLVVQAFSVPPDLAARGLTGEAVAGELLDDLVRLQARTDSVRSPGSYAIDWGDAVEVEIPQTGISLGELQRWLQEQLGRETRISGVVYRLPDGRLSVTARAGGSAGAAFVGSEAEFDALMERAAESVYAATQPYRHAIYLNRNGREAEALERFRRQTVGGAQNDRGWAHIGMGIARLSVNGDLPSAMKAFADARRLMPRNPVVALDIAAYGDALGREEHTYRMWRTARELYRDGDTDQVQPIAVRLFALATEAAIAAMEGDFARQAAVAAGILEGEDINQNHASVPWTVAWSRAKRHDWSALEGMLRSRALGLEGLFGEVSEGAFFLRLAAPLAAEDWAEVVARAEAIEREATALPPPLRAYYPHAAPKHVWAPQAVALARLGRVDAARALLARTAPDCQPCVLARAQVEEAAGRRAAAERWFAEAARQTPSLPQAHAAWGRAKLARGDADGAIPLLREAQERGPRWADPLKYEGDALARQGKHREAVRRYEAAAARAPRWGALHLAWGRSLAAQGRGEPAREKYAQAARLDLSAADRAAVAALLARRGG